MSRLSIATRIKGAVTGWRMPFVGFGASYGDGEFIPKDWDWNWWQEGKDPLTLACCSAVEAGVSAYAQTVAMLPGTVWRKDDDGGRSEMPNTPLARMLANPNGYQTRSDFLMNQIRALYYKGNCYAIATDDEKSQLHPVHPGHVTPYVNRDTNDIFWSLAPTDLTPGQTEWPLDTARLVPDEYVWHVHLATPQHPLCGVTPLTSCALSIAANCNLNRMQLAFLANMSRPSGTLNTDLKLTKDQVDELRQRWKEHSSGKAMGGTPILTHGLKWQQLTLSAPDTQLIDFYKLTVADIARALRVPLPLIGVMDGATFNNAETLMQFWKASGLGWLLEHLELSLDKFYGLPRDQYCELDSGALLRSDFKTRIDGLVRGVQGGIFAPNEARAMEGLAAVAEGDMPRVQQQLVPLDYEPPAPAPAAPALPAPDDADDDQGEPVAQKHFADVAAEAIGARLGALEVRVAVLLDRSDRAPIEQAEAMTVTRGLVLEHKAEIARLTKRNSNRERELATLAESVTAALDKLGELAASVEARVAELRDGVDGTLQNVFRGPWSIDNIYQAGDLVLVPDGGLWLARALTHDFPLADSEEWQEFLPPPKAGAGFQHRGLYQSGMDVAPGDVVLGSEGAAWVWRGEPARSLECPGEAWSLFAKQGERGGRGRPGDPGPRGASIVGVTGEGNAITFHASDGRSYTVEFEAQP